MRIYYSTPPACIPRTTAQTSPLPAHLADRAESPFRPSVSWNSWGLHSSPQTPISFVRVRHPSAARRTSAV